MRKKILLLFIGGIILSISKLLAQNAHESLKAVVNHPDFVEYAPTVSADGKTLLFESDRINNGGWGIYESRFVDGKWSIPKSIEPINNFQGANALIGGPSLSYDGNTLYFFASFNGNTHREEIYYSTREGNTWSEPKNIGEPINTLGYEGFPSISADGKNLYFIRENTESKVSEKLNMVCYKIFVSEKNKEGKWSEPTPLPDPINIDCDKSPRIMSDNRTLIFSSIRGEKTKEVNFDLYLSKLDDEGLWSEPTPLSFANSPENDYAASVSASGDVLYYFNKGDITTSDIPPDYRQLRNITIQGLISDFDSKKGLETQVNVYDAQTTEQIMQLKSASDGKYTVVLSEGHQYNIEITKDGYSSYTFDFDLRNLKAYQEFSRDIVLYEKVDLLLTVNDFEIYEPLPASIKVFDMQTQQEFPDLGIKVDAKGKANLKIPVGKRYKIQATLENFVDTSFVFDLTGVIKYRTFEQDLLLHPVKVDYQIEINDSESLAGMPVEFILVNKNRNERIAVNPEMGVDGKYTLKVRQGDEYDLEIKIPKGYAFFGDNTLNGKKNTEKNKLKVGLMPIRPNTKLELYNITFESGASELNENCTKELNRILGFLMANPNLKLEIAAHTDNKSTASFNLILSRKRAKSVYEYLIEKSIEPNRLVAKGYGLEKPIADNDTPENMAKNRRFELIVISL
jgi:outer membrane protein OmpA-like peptidoglycan-associated protein/Tol biopolymer transport system component